MQQQQQQQQKNNFWTQKFWITFNTLFILVAALQSLVIMSYVTCQMWRII